MIILKTLLVQAFSKEACIEELMNQLAVHCDSNLIRQLSHINKAIHSSKNLDNTQKNLINQYTSYKMKTDLEQDVRAKRPSILFNSSAIKLLDELLRITPIQSHKVASPFNIILSYKWNGFLFEPVYRLHDYNLIEKLFLLANTIIYHLEGDGPSKKIEKYSEKNKIFYSRQNIHGLTAIGRAFMMYNYAPLSDKLKKIGIDREKYMGVVFALCSHVENMPFIELELPASIKSMFPEKQQDFKKYLPMLSINIQSINWEGNEVKSKLSELYFNDKFCCQKPLIQIEDRYYCLQPKLLWATLSDLSYYLLLDSCERDKDKVKRLNGIWGEAFENSFKRLVERVFTEEKCKGYECKKKYKKLDISKGHSIGDSFVMLNENARLIFEFKGNLPTNEIKLGDRRKSILKFIDLEKKKGIPQLLRDSKLYRLDNSYKGVLYIIFVCRGPIPLTKDFDDDLQVYLNNRKDYQEFLENSLNKPLIFLDAFLCELFFNAIMQGIPILEMLESISGLFPSQIRPVIIDKISQYGFKFPLSPLYDSEIENSVNAGRLSFKN